MTEERFKRLVKATIDQNCIGGSHSNGKHVFSIVVSGNGFLARKHNVMISIDFTTQELKYYDPKGKPAGEYGVDNGSVQNYLETIAKDYRLKIVQEFPEGQHRQKDIHSCGYFVALKMAQEVGLNVDDDDFLNPRQKLVTSGWAFEQTFSTHFRI